MEEILGVNPQERAKKALQESFEVVLREALEFDEANNDSKNAHAIVVRDQGFRP